MYSTQKHITNTIPQRDDAAVTGRFLRYPKRAGERVVEGGLRTQNVYKHSPPGAPLVSIITVCLNSEDTLEQCIQSVLRQTYDNIEYIVIDGGSLDRTIDIINKYSAAIDYFVSEPDRGLYHAMNKGLELAGGDYILILNSDDWYEFDCVRSLVRARDYSGCDFVGSLATYIDEKNGRASAFKSMPFDKSCFFRMPLRHETLLISSEIYNRVGLYDEEYRIIADRDLIQRMYLMGCTYYEVPRALLNFRMSGVSHERPDLLVSERRKILARTFDFLSESDIGVLGGLEPIPPDEYHRLALTYLKQPTFLFALKAYFEDNRRCGVATLGDFNMDWAEVWDRADLPQVSFILPIYNAERTLSRTLRSLLGQSFSSFEIICLDDNSPDNSWQTVDQYAALDNRIRPFANEINVGLGATRNRGVSLARGLHIFHVDPDDTVPENALQLLVACARINKSQLVKGSFASVNDDGSVRHIRYPCNRTRELINTDLKATSGILHSTEGHWSILYDRSLAESVPYPTDLKMGQDSSFLVNVFCRARSVSLIPDVVYNYHANPDSAMNTFNRRKYFDDLEWRRRAWHVTNDYGVGNVGDFLLQTYWHEPFIRAMAETLGPSDQIGFIAKVGDAFREAGYKELSMPPDSEFLRSFFAKILMGQEKDALHELTGNSDSVADDCSASMGSSGLVRATESRPLSVLALCTLDRGGAAIAARRLANLLRSWGVNSANYALIVNGDDSEFTRIRSSTYEIADWGMLQKKSIISNIDCPNLNARELFSNTESLVNFKENEDIFTAADIVHLHWVVGMFDFENAAEVLSGKQIVWTLHDMNPFTGGCHYSEGCDGYLYECEKCPMLGENNSAAHENWKIKKQVYSRLKDLQIICPSRWLAECARKSSLFSARQIHVIENAYPVDTFRPTNKVLARTRLGLPLDKRLILFGADHVENKRKGGDILLDMLSCHFAGFEDDVNLMVFGSGKLKTKIPTHGMGTVHSEAALSIIYSAADVLVFPSREDNAPLTVGESLLCGTPVVGFSVGSVADLVEHEVNGYIAEYECPGSLAKGIGWALYDLDWQRKTKRSLLCRIKAAEFLNPVRVVLDHLGVYRSARDDRDKQMGLTEAGSLAVYVVTPCLNAAETISETIESVLRQSGNFRMFYHVQDGGSDDGTIDILRSWERRLCADLSLIGCSEVVFSWQSTPDSGMYQAITRAFDRLSPKDDDFLTWINGDDLLLPDALATVALIAKAQPEVKWIGSPTYNILHDGKVNCSRANPTPTEVIREGLCDGAGLHWPHLQQEGTFFRGDLWKKSKHILANYRLAGDWALWREFAHHTQYFQVDAPLGAFRIRAGQLSAALKDKYEAEIDDTVPRARRALSFNRLYAQRQALVCNRIRASVDEGVVEVSDDPMAARDYFYKKGQVTTQVEAPSLPSVVAEVTPENFDYFTYARDSHWNILKKYEPELYEDRVEPAHADLKRYQDLLTYAFIKNNVKPGARILEIGGGNSRILRRLSSTYECWLVDKLEGVGNGPKHVNIPGIRFIRDYIGSGNPDLPDNYFDFVFSISVLEHVPQDDEGLLASIVEDTNRVLKKGGYSLHLFDVVFKDGKPREFSRLIHLMFKSIVTSNSYRDFVDVHNEGGVYYLTDETYNRIWKKYTKKSYAEFGSPTSCNVLWRGA